MFWGKKKVKEVKYEKKLVPKKEMKKVGRSVIEIEMLDGRLVQREVFGYFTYMTYPIREGSGILTTADMLTDNELVYYIAKQSNFIDYREPKTVYYHCVPIKAEVIFSNPDYEVEYDVTYEELSEVTE